MQQKLDTTALRDLSAIKKKKNLGLKIWLIWLFQQQLGTTDLTARKNITTMVGCIFPKLPLSGEGQEEKGMTEDEMVGWCHRLDGHEFVQALGVGDGQESLVCCSPWGREESDPTERLN